MSCLSGRALLVAWRQLISRRGGVPDGSVDLAERLLRSGVSPSHVRRIVRELRDHHSDLIEQLTRRGYHLDEAADEAQLLLGDRDVIITAIQARTELRSRARRFALLLFGVAPLLIPAPSLGVYIAADAMGWSAPGYVPAALLMIWIVPFLVSLLLSWIAACRRMSPLWPVVGVALSALTSSATSIHFNRIEIGSQVDVLRLMTLACGLLIAYALASVYARKWHVG